MTHEKIVLEEFKVECTKNVRDMLFTFFTEGEEFNVINNDGEWTTIDQSGHIHVIADRTDTNQEWFNQHFKIISERVAIE